MVICCHFLTFSDGLDYTLATKLLKSAVPIFYITSFYFLSYVKSIDRDFMNRRVKRLFVPQIGWSFILWFAYNLLSLIYKTDKKSLLDLFKQLITGHCYNTPMWFQVDLILLTLLYFLIRKISTKNTWKILLIMCIMCITFQYTNLNFILFDSLQFWIKYPLGRLAEVIPFCTCGIILQHFNIMEKLKKKYIVSIIVCAICFVFLWLYPVDEQMPQGFGYQGIFSLIFGCLAFCLFYLIPFNGNVKIKKILLEISRHTLGVYCMHLFVGNCLSHFFNNNHSWLFCIFIFFVCMFFSILISLIPNKTIKQLVS